MKRKVTEIDFYLLRLCIDNIKHDIEINHNMVWCKSCNHGIVNGEYYYDH